jgi:hypothetical protein
LAKLRLAEVFGYKVENHSPEAQRVRERKWCPFRMDRCTKYESHDPLGVCSLIEQAVVVVTCPYRFREGGAIFRDAAQVAFGTDRDTVVIPEVPFLRSTAGPGKLGKIDFVLARHAHGRLVDFCALEVQSVYMSGEAMRQEFNHFLETGQVIEPRTNRHADYRSSSHKRLMPQLMLKVPALRRWGKKVLIAIHEDFYEWLPRCLKVDPSNAELTWLIYRAEDVGDAYHLRLREAVPTTLEGAVQSLTAAVPPPRDEFEQQLQAALESHLNGSSSST